MLTAGRRSIGFARLQISKGFPRDVLLLGKFGLEMIFDISMDQRPSSFGQYDGVRDFIPCDLGGDEGRPVGQFLVGELHLPAVIKCSYPLLFCHRGSIRDWAKKAVDTGRDPGETGYRPAPPETQISHCSCSESPGNHSGTKSFRCFQGGWRCTAQASIAASNS